MIQTRLFQILCYDLNLRPSNLVQGHCTTVTQRYSLGNALGRLGERKRRYDPDKWSRTDRQTDGMTYGRMDRQTDWSPLGARRAGP